MKGLAQLNTTNTNKLTTSQSTTQQRKQEIKSEIINLISRLAGIS